MTFLVSQGKREMKILKYWGQVIEIELPNKLYPLEDYMSFTCALVMYKTFLCKFISKYIPWNVKETLECEKWNVLWMKKLKP